MKRALVLLLSSFAATAAADVTPPTGWQSNPDFAAALSPRADLFGGLPATVHVDVYRAPIAGAVMYVTRAEAKVPAAQRDAAASYELEELRRAFERAGAGAKAQAQSQRVDPATKLAEGTLAWRDDSAALMTIRRVAIAADANRIVALTGECVLAADIAPAVAKACEQSLQTIVPDIALAQRVPLSIVGAAPIAIEVVAPAGSAAPSSTGPTMQDASKLPPLAPIQVAPPPARRSESDRRPMILGLGLVVLAVIFYLNRRRRERFEREDARAAARTDRPTDHDDEGTGASRDTDDDDLHAAAEREAPRDAKRDTEKKGDDDTN